MTEPTGPVQQALAALLALPGWALGAVGAVGLVWALVLWSAAKTPRSAKRLAGLAALALAFALLLMLGVTLENGRPLMPPWQWLIGLVVLPLLVRTRFGGPAAMLFFLCLSMGLAYGVGLLVDATLLSTSLWVAGLLFQGLAAVVAWFAPPPEAEPEPVPVAAEALQQRLDSAEANEAADKYTRE